MTIEQVCVREGQRLEISVCQAQAGPISHRRKEGDDSSGQFEAVLFMLGQAPQQRSQAYIQCRLEILMYTKRSQGSDVTSTASGLLELFCPARAGTAVKKKRVAFGCKTHTQNFHSTARHCSPLSTPPLACAYSFFVLISKSGPTLMYYTWGNLTQYIELRFQEDVVIFEATNLFFVSLPNRTKKKEKKLELDFCLVSILNHHLSPCSADGTGNIIKSLSCKLS